MCFGGGFPDDLPPGDYRVVLELRDEQGKVQQRHERRLAYKGQEKDPLGSLSDDKLLAEYVKRGEAPNGSGGERVDTPFRLRMMAVAAAYQTPSCSAWTAAHDEIVRRGKPIVPALMKMLEAEAVRNPGDANGGKLGIAVGVMGTLGEIGNAQPVRLLVRVMAGMGGKADLFVREEARHAAERLTYVTFYIDRDNPLTGYAMMDDGALISSTHTPSDAQLRSVAGLYAKWLDAEGRDPARWLALARQRAQKRWKAAIPSPSAVRSASAARLRLFGP